MSDTLQPGVENNELSETSVSKDPDQLPDVFEADLPPLVDETSPDTKERFVELFLAEIRNDNTRRAYGRAVGRFFRWADRQRLSLRSPRAPFPSTSSS